jgi:putative IMPACT (imprinted ancient) family translation regulator
VSDDGEPSGSAGKPIEGQILSRGLTSVLVVVVRYFGGSLLGVPGLIQAYKTAAAEALDQSGQVERTVEHELVIEFDYTLMNDVMMMIRQVDGRIGSQEMGLFCRYRLMIPLEQKDRAITLLADLRGVTMMENM